MAPFVIEEALLDRGTISDTDDSRCVEWACSWGGAVEAHGNLEEEGSSLTPEKDAEDENAAIENQVAIIPPKKSEIHLVEPEKQYPIEIEESEPKRGLKEGLSREYKMKYKSSLLQPQHGKVQHP